MARNYFGTDGIRGTANAIPMTAEIALRIGMSVKFGIFLVYFLLIIQIYVEYLRIMVLKVTLCVKIFLFQAFPKFDMIMLGNA